ncbi:hypothetical protein WR164_13670 [Philodulcilactobacillus myokoensis]|uniref:Replication protein n=1 Tax=Philodulcilactobacillus myokoensis TaxID=2929573 RepID=A0A9W6B2D5_9LACO|nr:hypothetical protein [Philodulcilactobacillus myokoensis]GLB47388.1 hypothetical protein WR164_13670 [Philodulcilactobacillus myokoensis]
MLENKNKVITMPSNNSKYLISIFKIIPQGWDTVKGMHALVGFNQYYNKPVFTQYTNDADMVLNSINYRCDYFLTLNTVKTRNRSVNILEDNKVVNNVSALGALWVDIDFHNCNDQQTKELKDYISNHLIDLIDVADVQSNGRLLLPTSIQDSGHGIHLIYLFKNQIQVNNTGMLVIWRKLEREISKRINQAILSVTNLRLVDTSTFDPLRLIRVPSTKNYRNPNKPVKCHVIKTDYKQGMTYDFWNLTNALLPKRPTKAKNHPHKINNHHKPLINYEISKNAYTLNYERCNDLKKLINLRNNEMIGYRELTLFVYACFNIRIVDISNLANDLKQVNDMFNRKLPYAEIHNLVREMKYLDDKSLYKFKNSTIIDKLGISLDEQTKLKVLISKQEKYRRKNKKRLTRRRKLSQQSGAKAKRSLRNKTILNLFNKGLNPTQIAKQLSISRPTIYSVLKKV